MEVSVRIDLTWLVVATFVVIVYLLFKQEIDLYAAIIRDMCLKKAKFADLLDTWDYKERRKEEGAELIERFLSDKYVRSYVRRYGADDPTTIACHEFPALGRSYAIDLSIGKLMVTDGKRTVSADPRQLMDDIASELPHLDPLCEAKKIRGATHAELRWQMKYRD